jgi:cardiolipin synthase A/B
MFNSDIWIVIDWIYAFTIIVVTALIILENRRPEKTVSWIIVLILIPVLGVILYIFFGQEYRKRKLFSRKGLKSSQRLRILQGKQLKILRGITPAHFEKHFEISLGIMKMLFASNDSIITENNHVKILIDGKDTFNSIMEAIRQARHHIHLEFYIIANDKLGSEILLELCRKAEEGVKVRILYDDVGSWTLKKDIIKKMQKSGVGIFSFQKVRFPILSSKVNYRNHRKLVVVDGNIGFTGGLNISDRYLEGDPELGYWRDTFVRIEGEAVWGIQNIFAADWFFTTKENITHIDYYPLVKEKGESTVQILSSGPDSDWPAISQFYFTAISQAREQVYIASPYFLPPGDIITALITAALRGVDVRIILPHRSDSLYSDLATESYMGELLESGIRMYRYTKGFIHSKTVVVDRQIVSIGSANMDFCSLETNFEINAIIYDRKLATEMITVFHSDLENCKAISLRTWKKRPLHRKFFTSASRLLSPVL